MLAVGILWSTMIVGLTIFGGLTAIKEVKN